MPSAAVVDEGVESYVFRQNGDHFERVSVHVIHRDQRFVVIENDGQLFPADVVVAHGAFQLQQEMKKKAGGAIDPHAGHGH